MARIAGKVGTVTVGNSLGGVSSWEIDYEGRALDSTGMDDDGVAQFTQGRTEWSGSCSGFWETGNEPDSSLVGAATTTSIDISMVTSNGQNYTGNGIVTRYHAEAAVDGAVQYTLDFQGMEHFLTPT